MGDLITAKFKEPVFNWNVQMNGPATTTVGQPQDRRERSGWVKEAGSRGRGLAQFAQRSGALQAQRGHGCTLGLSVIAGQGAPQLRQAITIVLDCPWTRQGNIRGMT
ncbi:MAG TPA: hypothetical protein VFE51_27990 [Verrucomicrobiae bacterium]|nr:hypothetical protein [Verrucomicrobiae bacterium]